MKKRREKRRESGAEYAVESFRLWAAAGCPSDAESRAQYSGAVLADFRACNAVFHDTNEDVRSAVRDIYMAERGRYFRKGEIAGRVARYSMEHYVSEREVYNWLAMARREFIRARGLRIDWNEKKKPGA